MGFGRKWKNWGSSPLFAVSAIQTKASREEILELVRQAYEEALNTVDYLESHGDKRGNQYKHAVGAAKSLRRLVTELSRR